MKDVIVNEIRRIRRTLDQKIAEAPKGFHQEIVSIQRRYKDRLVTLAPKPLQKSTD